MRPVKIGGQLHPNPLDQVDDYTSGGGIKTGRSAPDMPEFLRQLPVQLPFTFARTLPIFLGNRESPPTVALTSFKRSRKRLSAE
ncbi:MAG: hypothetical protein GY768_27480 [Planctomycetaceae bacterium]|nr:hypothetical protein [Planctomycetaceae bacterium]